jgi:long-subunit acyl-CoA synthetase (AMP-forming)
MVENRVSILVGVPKLFHALYEKLEHTIQENRLARFLWRYAPTLLGAKIKKRLVGGNQLKYFSLWGRPPGHQGDARLSTLRDRDD